MQGVAVWALTGLFIPVAAAQIFGFSSQPGQGDLKGKPRSALLQRETLRDDTGKPADPRKYVVEETHYRDDGEIEEHRASGPGGVLSTHEVYQYDVEGHKTKVTTYDQKDAVSRTQFFHRSEPGIEEETTQGADGKPAPYRAIRHFDERGHLLEETDTVSGKPEMHATFRYDDEGRPVEINLASQTATTPGSSMQAWLRIEALYQSGKQTIVTIYGADGSMM